MSRPCGRPRNEGLFKGDPKVHGGGARIAPHVRIHLACRWLGKPSHAYREFESGLGNLPDRLLVTFSLRCF